MSCLCGLVMLTLPVALVASEIDDYIENPPVIPNAPWGETDGPDVMIPRYQEMFRNAQTDEDKGIAVANLAYQARQMAAFAAARPAARELLTEWVRPHLKYTHGFRLSEFCCWRKTMITCRNAYESLGDREAEKDCLEKLYRANLQEGDQDLMIYLLAFHQARYGDYQKAIAAINFLPENSRWATHRKKLVSKWAKRDAKKKKEFLKHE